jgi:TRAP-type mannitol/chloroaromatic compound transport system substrate-binding protein
MKRSRFLFILFLAAALTLGLLPESAQAKMLFKTQSGYATGMSVLGDAIVYFSKSIEEASGGDLTFKVYEPDKLVPTMEALEAVSKGRIEACYVVSGFFAGKLPVAPIFSSVPFGPEAPEFAAWMFQGNGMKLNQEMYDRAGYKVKVWPLGFIAPETSGWFRKEIKTLDDLKGLKMRFYGLGGQVMKKLGVAVTLLPPAEIFSALEKGALDATEFSMPSLDKSLGFHKVCKYNYFPGWHQQATYVELFINKDIWEKKMNASQRKMVEIAVKASLFESLAIGEAAQPPVIKENMEKHGVTIKYWGPEFLAAFKKAWLEVVEEQKANDPYFKKVWEDLEAFRKDYAVYQSLSSLPRKTGWGK